MRTIGARSGPVAPAPPPVVGIGSGPLLVVDDLSVRFGTGSRAVPVVDSVSFVLRAGESLAIVGESGSGKTTVALALAGLLDARRSSVSGRAFLDGVDLLSSPAPILDRLRGPRIGFVFQDPLSSLNPVQTVGSQIAEVFRAHRRVTNRSAMAAAIEVLQRVQIPDAGRRARQYPHEFSGGMRQRVMIGLALALEPDLVIADEPTTALDVTIQAQIIDLLDQLRTEANIALLLITHDLGVAGALASRLAVLYAGRLAEVGSLRDAFRAPYHPYTRGLLESAGRDPGTRLRPIPGTPPRPDALPSGCAFHPRCVYAADPCRRDVPRLRTVAPDHRAACHFAEAIVAGTHPIDDLPSLAKAEEI